MPVIAVNGDNKVKTITTEVAIKWKVRDFFSLSGNVDDEYRSPVFDFAGSQWLMRLFPNGDSKVHFPGWVGIYLMRGEMPGSSRKVYYRFAIETSDGVEVRSDDDDELESSEKKYQQGLRRFWLRSELRSKKSTLVPNNTMTIICHLRRKSSRRAFTGEEKVLRSLLKILSKEDSDIVIKIDGKEFPAHRAILRARSPVFNAMFSHDMEEGRSNVVTIEDGDPETFPDFLSHIYSGSCEQISAKNVCSLYSAAEKYHLSQLKRECARFIKLNLTVPCFCDVLTLAVTHDDKELIELATYFFCDNSADIANTAEWKTFLEENSTVGKELLSKAKSQ